MRAYLVTKYKAPVTAGQVDEPVLGDHDVLVDIHAAGLNLLDAKIRDGEFKLLLPYKPPFVLGHDLAGVVARTGRLATRFAVGDAVYGRVRDGRIGTFAERIAVHEDDLAAKPERLTMGEAASVPLVALTAWQALVEIADVRPGQKVLVHAGSGGVGTYAIQLAKHLGATVATTTGPSNLEWVKALGADTVIDYRTEDFAQIVKDYDVVIDSQGGQTLMRSLKVLRPGGIAIGIAGPPDPAFARRQGLALPLRLVMSILSFRARRTARALGVRYSFLFMRADGGQLAQIAALVDDGTLSPVVDQSYPFDQMRQALEHVESGRAKGKVVLSVRAE